MNQLWTQYFADRSEANKLSLFNHYIRITEVVAGSVLRRVPKSALVTTDDLVSVGLEALWKCIDRYDPDRKAQFSTFAGNRIRGAMLDWIRYVDWVPRREREAQRDAGAATAEMCSLEALTGWQDSGREDMDETEIHEDLRQVYRCLSHLQRRVAHMLFIQELSPSEVSKRLQFTPLKVKEIREEIIHRVRESSPGNHRAFQRLPA